MYAWNRNICLHVHAQQWCHTKLHKKLLGNNGEDRHLNYSESYKANANNTIHFIFFTSTQWHIHLTTLWPPQLNHDSPEIKKKKNDICTTIPKVSWPYRKHDEKWFKSTASVRESSFPQKIHPAFVQDPLARTWCTFEGSFHSQQEACNENKYNKILVFTLDI